MLYKSTYERFYVEVLKWHHNARVYCRKAPSVMSNKTIAKFCGFVISISLACVFGGACGFVSSDPLLANADSRYGPPRIAGTIKSPEITESSGLAASRCQENVLWTHNDSGDDAYIFAINSAGASLGVWKVPNATNIDWEDMAAYKDAAGKCYLYVGEIGDNKTVRHEHVVYRVAEPVIIPDASPTTRKSALVTANAEIIKFTYPDYDQDAETLMVHPKTGDIYIATKRISGPAGVYRLRPDFAGAQTQKAEWVAEISVPAVPNGLLTGGDISPDGRRLVVCDYDRAYEFVLPESANNFEDVWLQTPQGVDLGRRKNGEAVCYNAAGTSIFATSEQRSSPVIEVKRKQ